jgi:hypothetical protein|tara:strand:+ start:332 stop:514 length:183 start_codon:yes stop_codon:yes gene_type:complete
MASPLELLQTLRKIPEETAQTQLEHQRQLFNVDPTRKSRKRSRCESQIWREEAVQKKTKE